jgi:MFS family permease
MDQSPVKHDPLESLRYPGFRLSAIARLLAATGTRLFAATVLWQIYDISHSTGKLALVGLVQFLPSLCLGLVGGAIADRYDQRMLSVLAEGLMLLSGAALMVVSHSGHVSLSWIYGMAFMMSVASAFDSPARAALLPALVPREAFQNAITVQSTAQQLGFVTGPALGGFLIYFGGPALAYLVYAAFFAVAIVLLLLMRLLPVEIPKRAVSLAGIVEGIQFVKSRQVVLGAMTLDMFAVIFGGATALLPVYAEDILHVGSLGYGILAGSADVGAFVASVALVALPPIRRVGRSLLIGVAIFGAATIVFGLSRWFALSLGAYVLIGIADQISVVCRQTTIQLATPDDLRGRVTSVNMLFIGASNQLGTVESGFVAAVTSATFAVVSGGIGCLAVLGTVATTLPRLREFTIDRRMAEPLAPVEAELRESPAAGQ